MNRSNGTGFLSFLGAAVGNEGFEASSPRSRDSDASFEFKRNWLLLTYVD